MDFDEQQRVLDRINKRDVERSGWVGFVIGILLTVIMYHAVFIPMAVENARAEAQGHSISDL